MPAIKVTPVQGFKTSDGQVFEDEDTARSEEAKIQLHELLNGIEDWPANNVAAYAWLCSNRKLIGAIDLILQEIY
jgi:hypothetical protein